MAPFVKKKRGSICCRVKGSSLAEGLAVSALVLSGVSLVSTHQDPIQGAEVFVLAVIGALLYGAFDTFVGVMIHKEILLFIWVQH